MASIDQSSPGLERITLTPKQSNIFVWGWQESARFRTAVCGRRFGKTFLAAREMKRAAQIAAKNNISPDEEIWYGAPTFKQAKRVFWPRLKRAIPRHWVQGRREDECSITMVTGHTLRIVGLDNYDDLRGSGLYFFIGDEWADAQPECWSEVIQPMLATSHGHSLMIGTPKGYDHFYDQFQKGQPGATDAEGQPITDSKSWHYTTEDGGNVPPAEIARFKRDLDPRTYEQEFRAGFVTYAGRVYYAFDRKLSVRPCPYRPRSNVYIGMDFNVNPMTATIWQDGDNGESFQIDEILLSTSNTDEMAAEITRKYGRAGFDPTRPKVDHITIYPDPAGAQRKTSAQGRTDISILRDAGFNVVAMASAPQVRDRVNVTNARWCNAGGERRQFVDPCCVKSIQAYERHSYKEGTSDPDKGDGFDHLCDATGYFNYGRYEYKPPRNALLQHIGR